MSEPRTNARDWLLLVITVVVTTALALVLIQWLAPGLLGARTDLELVRADRRVTPFYDAAFRKAPRDEGSFTIKDPRTRVRTRPLFPDLGLIGPHDLLGFRNRAIPTAADVVTIGDSQTYGNNAALEQNWPSQMAASLAPRACTVYSMAAGGWGAVQYLEMLDKAVRLRPAVLVVALYTGNDPLESFTMAYASERWADLRPDPELSSTDAPSVAYPPPRSEWWEARLPDGISISFAPRLRGASNMAHPAVDAGYAIMARVAERIGRAAAEARIATVFTIIPTKELVYAPRIEAAGVASPEPFVQLVRDERARIAALRNRLESVPGAVVTDVVGPLQEAARSGAAVYSAHLEGHPAPAGYRVIGETVARAVAPLLEEPPADGLYARRLDDDRFRIVLLRDGKLWPFISRELVESHGWRPGQLRPLAARDLARFPMMPEIVEVDLERFGPRAP